LVSAESRWQPSFKPKRFDIEMVLA
jgi:hypothetical protein